MIKHCPDIDESPAGVDFTHEELIQLLDAVGQYIENQDDPNEVPAAAVTACEKLELYASNLGES